MNHCENCGVCCMHMRTPPFIGSEDPQWVALPKKLKHEITVAVFSDLPEESPCIWLGTDLKCTHYDLRPDICRDFQVGSESCRTYRKTIGLTLNGLPVVSEDDE